ncbi:MULTISPECIES: hypothetical protein [Xenorhabdus]|uniref:hypothetical protein n=1 Tax=Xenorhabdus TaxID=626 RepID=UPI000649E3C2|nr:MULTISPECIES: hypothetical protein [Xenorhabdus]KLU15127.1 hypothetical protein AAY47_12540 [Xenorhabdus griffiniae]KOP34118.1 hypothetical protein AFK69_06330 [Xenorhabdus sp. GDc328]
MAKKSQQEDNLGGLPTELQTDPIQNSAQPAVQPETESIKLDDVISKVGHGDDDEPASDASDFVVANGRTVRHNGVEYPENTLIEVYGDDANRLTQLGVIVRLDDLRAKLLSNAAHRVVGMDGVRIQQED